MGILYLIRKLLFYWFLKCFINLRPPKIELVQELYSNKVRDVDLNKYFSYKVTTTTLKIPN